MLTKLTSHPGVKWARQRRIGVWRRLLRGRLLRVHRLLVHRRHLRLVLHVVHGVHEVLLVRGHPVLDHVLLRVHVVRHLLRLLQRRTPRHAPGRRRCRLQLTRGVHRGRRGLMPIRTVPVRLRTHMPHLRRTVRPVPVLFHLLVVP